MYKSRFFLDELNQPGLERTWSPEQAGWEYPPIEAGSTVNVLGRSEAGDIPELSGQTGEVVGCEFVLTLGNVYSVKIGSDVYKNIAPAMLQMIAPPPAPLE